eukprot:scaffold57104_cov17-Prasinocladus_malaysianus.AAC.1
MRRLCTCEKATLELDFEPLRRRLHEAHISLQSIYDLSSRMLAGIISIRPGRLHPVIRPPVDKLDTANHWPIVICDCPSSKHRRVLLIARLLSSRQHSTRRCQYS